MKLLLLFMIFSTMVFSDIKIMISNEDSLKTVSQEKLAALYLGKINSIDGIEVTPVDNKSSYKEFYKRIIKKTPKQLKAYWIKEMYEGKRVPPKKMSTAEIKKAMKSRKIIAYASVKFDGTIVMKIY